MVMGRLFGIRVLVAGLLACCVLAVVGVSSAFAEEGEAPSPWWHLGVTAVPSELAPGSYAQIVVTGVNVGDGEANGASVPIVVSDRLPAGIVPIRIEGSAGFLGLLGHGECSLAAVSCTFGAGVRPIPPFEDVEVVLLVRVEPSLAAGVAVDEAAVEGGGAPRALLAHRLSVGEGPTPLGLQGFDFVPEAVGGAPATQAGSHPFQLTTTLDLNEVPGGGHEIGEETTEVAGGSFVKDVHVSLPPGLVGDPTAIPQCTAGQFDTKESNCPADTVIGVAVTTIVIPGFTTIPLVFPAPLFNLVPQVGEPARFGFNAAGSPVTLDTRVRTGGDYGIDVTVANISQNAKFLGSELIFWGVPGDPRHNSQRGIDCVGGGEFRKGPCEPLQEVSTPPPLLTLPASCSTPWTASTSVDSWAAPSVLSSPVEYALQDQFGHPLGLSGCNRLSFEPSIVAIPDGSEGSTPTGLTVDVHVPQKAGLNPTG